MSVDVASLADAIEAPLERVGGKARALSRMIRAGFNVPAGFVVAPDSPLDVEAIRRQLDAMGPGPLAVRSSGASEDAPGSSLAGRYLSLLQVEAHSITDAISRVRSSAGVVGPIPVIVQRMIEPVCAGVAFTADPVTGDRDKTIVTATGGLADGLLSGRVAGDDWEIRGRKARAKRESERVLNARLARRIARVAGEIEDDFGRPQDVEWAWDGDELWVVQARSITGLPDEVSWEPPAAGIYHRSLRFGEWIPEPVTPLFESWLLPRMERRLHDRLVERIGQVAPEPLHVVVNGWYYYSLNWLPMPGVAFSRSFFSIVRRARKDWRTAAPMFPQTVRYGYQRCEDDWRRNTLPRYREATSRAEAAVADLGAFDLVGLVDGLADEAGSYFASIATVAGSAYKFEQQLAAFWNKHLRKKLGVSHMVALQGLDLPAEIDGTPRLESLDWAVPTTNPQNRSLDNGEVRARRDEIVTEAEAVLAGSRRRLRRFRRLLAEAQHVVPVREEQLALLSLPWPVMRTAVQGLGEILVESGSIDSVGDIHYLSRAEVESSLATPRPMQNVIALRREERARASRLAAPLWVGKVPWTVKLMFWHSSRVMGAVRSDGAIVHGVPSSPGRASGTVRVIRDSSQFDEFRHGEVLVAPLTAPAWTELFDRASAVVTDVGSALAHASIIAREFGIPAVVGCGDATSRLRNGQIVTVDGTTGNVELATTPPTEH